MLVKDFIEKIKQNGLPWARKQWYNYENNSACVLGQGLINCGHSKRDLEMYGGVGVLGIPNNLSYMAVISDIIAYNDEGAASIEEAIQYAVERLTPYADIDMPWLVDYSEVSEVH